MANKFENDENKVETSTDILEIVYQMYGHDLAPSFEDEGYDVDVIVDLAYSHDHDHFCAIWDDLTDVEKQSAKDNFKF